MVSNILDRLRIEILNLRNRLVVCFFLLPWFVYTIIAFLDLFMPMSFIPPFSQFTSTDEMASYLLTKAIAEKRGFAITDYTDTFLIEHPFNLIVIGDEVYIRFLPGLAFVGVPFYIFGRYIAMLLNLEGILLERFLFFCTRQVSVLSAAYSVLLIYRICKILGTSERSSCFTAYIFAFATINLVYARTFFTHSLGAMLVLFSFYTILRILKGTNNEKLELFLSGLILGYSTIVRYSNALILFPTLLLFMLNKKLRLFSIFLVAFCTIIPVHMLYSFVLFGNPFTSTYGQIVTFKPLPAQPYEIFPYPAYINLWWQLRGSYYGLHILYGLFILLFSPFRGIFFYSPVLILSLLGIFRKFKQKDFNIAFFSLTSFVGIAAAYAFVLPIGGWEWSARYMSEVVPLLVIHISALVDENKTRLSNISFNALYIWSIFAMVLGIYPKFWMHACPLFRALEYLFVDYIYLLLVISIFSFILVITAYTGAYASLNKKQEDYFF